MSDMRACLAFESLNRPLSEQVRALEVQIKTLSGQIATARKPVEDLETEVKALCREMFEQGVLDIEGTTCGRDPETGDRVRATLDFDDFRFDLDTRGAHLFYEAEHPNDNLWIDIPWEQDHDDNQQKPPNDNLWIDISWEDLQGYAVRQKSGVSR